MHCFFASGPHKDPLILATGRKMLPWQCGVVMSLQINMTA